MSAARSTRTLPPRTQRLASCDDSMPDGPKSALCLPIITSSLPTPPRTGQNSVTGRSCVSLLAGAGCRCSPDNSLNATRSVACHSSQAPYSGTHPTLSPWPSTLAVCGRARSLARHQPARFLRVRSSRRRYCRSHSCCACGVRHRVACSGSPTACMWWPRGVVCSARCPVQPWTPAAVQARHHPPQGHASDWCFTVPRRGEDPACLLACLRVAAVAWLTLACRCQFETTPPPERVVHKTRLDRKKKKLERRAANHKAKLAEAVANCASLPLSLAAAAL